MSVPVGLTIPKLLPITGSFVLPFSAYFTFLALRVSQQRIQEKTYIGDSTAAKTDQKVDPLDAASRAHGNFSEHVPLALFIASVVELNGGDRKVLSASLSALFVFRILHAEFGLMRDDSRGPGRGPGHFGTLGFMLGMAGYAGYLVKGYWGF